MKLEQEATNDSWLQVLEAKFLVCARDSHNQGSAVMNSLKIESETEKAIFNIGERN